MGGFLDLRDEPGPQRPFGDDLCPENTPRSLFALVAVPVAGAVSADARGVRSSRCSQSLTATSGIPNRPNRYQMKPGNVRCAAHAIGSGPCCISPTTVRPGGSAPAVQTPPSLDGRLAANVDALGRPEPAGERDSDLRRLGPGSAVQDQFGILTNPLQLKPAGQEDGVLFCFGRKRSLQRACGGQRSKPCR